MNPMRSNDRSSRTRGRTGGPAFGTGAGSERGSRFGSPASSRSGGPSRSAGQNRSAGYGRRPAAVQGEFALPKTITPALPAVEAFADLDMPAELLAALATQGMRVPFPIQGATLPNTLAGRDALGRGRTGSGKTLA
ncbi:ATP-dependent helicase, partial [Streptomyces sp. NPDC101754]